jgi:hypothetical protein
MKTKGKKFNMMPVRFTSGGKKRRKAPTLENPAKYYFQTPGRNLCDLAGLPPQH